VSGRASAPPAQAGQTERRLVELEIKVTYQEDTIEQLHQVILQQQAVLDRLERRLAELEERQWVGSAYDRKTRDEPPPHY
jgi:SlyX protein